MTAWFADILKWIHSWLGSYGWSVIVFSLLIKVVLLPLDIKSRRSMRAMSALNPQLEKLKARYGNDQQKLNQKMSELYRKNKVSPLSGCPPLLIQLPLLWIMFAAMRNVAAELQLSSMIKWINDMNLIESVEDGVTTLVDAGSDTVQNILAAIREGRGLELFGSQESWLWIKSVFQADSFKSSVIPTCSELQTAVRTYSKILTPEQINTITAYYQSAVGTAIDEAVQFNIHQGKAGFCLFLNWEFTRVNFPVNWTYVNGLYILPVLAGVTQVLSTMLQPATADTSANNSGSGKFMKWFFPIFSVIICMTSTAAFAIYWVIVNIWSIVSSYIMNIVFEAKDKHKVIAPDTEKEALQP